MESMRSLVRTFSTSNVTDKSISRKDSSNNVNTNNKITKTSSKPEESNRVSLQQMGKLGFEQYKRIAIGETGSIHHIATTSLDKSAEAFEKNVATRDTLLVAAKLLKGKKLDSTEKKYEATALKVIDFYKANSESKNYKKELKLGLNTAADVLKAKIDNDTITTKNQEFGVKIEAKKTIEVSIVEFAGNKIGETSTAEDVYRFIHAGRLTIKNGPVEDVFKENNIDNSNTLHERPNEDDAIYMQRLTATLYTFGDKATQNLNEEDKNQLKADIQNLTDKLNLICINTSQKQAEIDDEEEPQNSASSIMAQLKETITDWEKEDSTPAQKNMVRLMHGMNQQLTDGMLRSIISAATKYLNDPNSPGSLLKIGPGLEPDFGKAVKKYQYEFDDNQVKVTVSCSVIVGPQELNKKNGRLEVLNENMTLNQVITMTAPLNNLTNWNCENIDMKISTTNKSENIELAKKFSRIASDFGTNSSVSISK